MALEAARLLTSVAGVILVDTFVIAYGDLAEDQALEIAQPFYDDFANAIVGLVENFTASNVSGVEGQREGNPPSLFQATYNHAVTNLSDNGDGTGEISWAEICVGDLLVDANTDPIAGDAVTDAANECLPSSAGTIDGVTFSASGLSANLPDETLVNAEDDSEIELGSTSLDMIAVDTDRSLFIGQSVRDVAYEEPNSFTDGIELSAHVLSEKTTSRTVAELEGTWGFVVRRLVVDDTQPNNLEYSASSLIVDVDSTGNATRTSELNRLAIQGLEAGSSSATFEKPAENTGQQSIGSLSIADDGSLNLLDGEFGGILSKDANVLFLALMNPVDPQADPTLVTEPEWITGVRISDTFTSADLEGKEYTVISQSYWVEPGLFEVDYLEPGATLSFPVGGGPASHTRATSFAYAEFADNLPLVRDGEALETAAFQYSVNSNGRITLDSDFGEPGIIDLELNGFATPDNRMLVLETTLIAEDSDGTTQIGGVGITYAVCVNCD